MQHDNFVLVSKRRDLSPELAHTLTKKMNPLQPTPLQYIRPFQRFARANIFFM